MFKSSLVVLTIESNAEHISTRRIAELIDRPKYQPIYVVARGDRPDGRPGVRTDKPRKFAYVATARRALVEGLLCVAHPDDFMPYSRRPTAREKHKIDLLYDQLCQFRYIVKASDDFTRDSGITVTGKGDGPDDIGMACLIGLYWSWIMRADSTFLAIIADHGLTLS